MWKFTVRSQKNLTKIKHYTFQMILFEISKLIKT